MDFTVMQAAWREMAGAAPARFDVEALVRETLARDRSLGRRVAVRDAAELATAAGLAALMFWMAAGAPVRWPWIAAGGLCVVIGLVFVRERLRRRALSPGGGSLRERMAEAVAEADHQIALLRSVAWWYLLPCTLAVGCILAGVVLGTRGSMSAEDWRTARWVIGAATLLMVPIVGAVYSWIWRLNQQAVTQHLEPHRQGLSQLIDQLDREPGASDAKGGSEG